MRRFLCYFLMITLGALTVRAQDYYYLFPDFIKSHLEFYDGSHADVRLNFDALGQKVLYYDGETLMEMTNLPMLRILEAEDRIFIVKDGLLCEVYDRPGGPVLVNWRFRKVNKGSKGALGLATQGKVEAMRISPYDFSAVDANVADLVQGTYLAEIWQKENANIYYIVAGDQQYKIRSTRDLYKAFPAQAKQIREYVITHNLNLVRAEDAFKIIDYLRSLLAE